MRSHIEDVLRLIRSQDVDGDLLTVGEADVEGNFFCGNLLCLLWEGHGDNTQQSWLCAVFSFLWVKNETAIKTHRARRRKVSFLGDKRYIYAGLALPGDLS